MFGTFYSQQTMQEQADELVASLIGLRSEDWVGTVKDSLGTPEQVGYAIVDTMRPR